jgi:hypothetical protein
MAPARLRDADPARRRLSARRRLEFDLFLAGQRREAEE